MEELIIREREFRESIAKATNESGLPAFILKAVFKDMFDQVNSIDKEEYELAKKKVAEKQKKDKKGEKKQW